jgi:hypothetical protein
MPSSNVRWLVTQTQGALAAGGSDERWATAQVWRDDGVLVSQGDPAEGYWARE